MCPCCVRVSRDVLFQLIGGCICNGTRTFPTLFYIVSNNPAQQNLSHFPLSICCRLVYCQSAVSSRLVKAAKRRHIIVAQPFIKKSIEIANDMELEQLVYDSGEGENFKSCSESS
jgi:hypothetical protein